MKIIFLLALISLEPTGTGDYTYSGGLHRAHFPSAEVCERHAKNIKFNFTVRGDPDIIIEHMCIEVVVED